MHGFVNAPPTPLLTRRPLSRVVQHKPCASGSAQRSRLLHLLWPHQHPWTAHGSRRWAAWKEGGQGGRWLCAHREACTAQQLPGFKNREANRHSPVGLQGFVMTTSLGGCGPASSAASQARSGCPLHSQRGYAWQEGKTMALCEEG